MRAIIYSEYGPPDVLHQTEIEKPKPKKNEMLVKVHASTVSSGVIWMRKGIHPDSRIFTFLLRLMSGIRKPKKIILGYEFSGTVEATGKDVKLFREGDEVFGTTTGLANGAYAEYVCIPEKWNSGIVSVKAPKLSFEEAAAIPVGGITALQILRKAKIRKGQKVLVYGASGNVGTYAVQLAKYFGAKVTGVCSTSNLELVKNLGADQTVDYTRENFPEGNISYDVIFDAVGKISKSKVRKIIEKGGRYLTVKTITNEKTEYFEFLNKLIEEDHLTPFIDRIYPMDQIVEAHRYVEKGHKRGSVVISIINNQTNLSKQ